MSSDRRDGASATAGSADGGPFSPAGGDGAGAPSGSAGSGRPPSVASGDRRDGASAASGSGGGDRADGGPFSPAGGDGAGAPSGSAGSGRPQPTAGTDPREDPTTPPAPAPAPAAAGTPPSREGGAPAGVPPRLGSAGGGNATAPSPLAAGGGNPADRPPVAAGGGPTSAGDDAPGAAAHSARPLVPAQAPRGGVVGDGPPTYDAEPTALPAAEADGLDQLVADTVLDGARYGTYTLRAVSVRGDSARFRGEPRRDALLTARFGTGPAALVLVAVAGGIRGSDTAHLAAADACRWIGRAVGRSHARLAEDIRAGRRGDLKSGLHRLTDRSLGKLRARAAELGVEPEVYTAGLRCLLLSADPACRTRVFFGVGGGGLFRLRDGAWQDLEPSVPDRADVTGAPVVGFGSAVPEATPEGDRLTMDLGIPTGPSPYIETPPPPAAEPFRFRASVARPGDTLLLCSQGLAAPVRGEAALAKELAERWRGPKAPGMAQFLADTQLRVKGYADDRTAVAVWEA
uniref:protein phosphatase 2C domain-containing protein n=1 Tax=Streptomyces pristinaespiralis TaxID=38300 RepID=UPI00384CE2BE